MLHRLVIIVIFLFVGQTSAAFANRIELTCIYNDGDEKRKWIELAKDATGRETVTLTNFVRYEWVNDDLFENYAWSCSVSDQYIKCKESWSMLDGHGFLSVNHKLSRTTGSYFRLGTGISRTKGKLPDNRTSAICRVTEKVKKLF